MQSETAEARSKATVSAPEHHIWRGYFLIVAATFCWGAAATAGKAVFSGQLFSGAASISPLVLTQARTTFSVLVLIVILLVRFGPGPKGMMAAEVRPETGSLGPSSH